jgi:predicted permease
MVFALAVTLLTTILVSLLPAVYLSRPAADALKEMAGAIAGSRSNARLRKIFVGFQIGLSTLLLIVAGLFAQTLGNLRTIDLGFQTANVATFTIFTATEYTDAHKLQVFRSLIEALATVPGVKAVGANTSPLLTGGHSDGPIQLPQNVKADNEPHSFFNAITPGYFDALGIPIKAGRNLSWKDWGSGRRYCLVNETLAAAYLADRNPVGTMLGRGSTGAPLDYEVIGVFANARYHDPRGPIPRQTFFSLDSRIHFASAINVFARIQGDPRAALPLLREQVRRVDPALLIANAGTLEDQLNRRLANERMLAMLSAAFAFLALVLAATGIYGVLSSLVAWRHREIGIRIALGARRGRVIRMVLGEMTATFLTGVFAGTAAAFFCGRLVEAQLYGVKPFDSKIFVTGIAALSFCALLAVALPAWRALRLDPAAVLRHE